MLDRKYDFVIVGSGAGGATLAHELAKKGKQVLVIERGKPERRIGTLRNSLRYYDMKKFPPRPLKSEEGVIIWRAIMAGGSTVVSCGLATRCLEKEFSDLGITLNKELKEAEREMNVSPIPEEFTSEVSRKITQASMELGYKMEPIPRACALARCNNCGNCVFGCKNGAKWTAQEYLEEAKQNGADFLYNTEVDEVLTINGKARGVRGRRHRGGIEILSDVVVLAAGGLGTPLILQKSGIKEAGQGLFVDLFVNTYGAIESPNRIKEPITSINRGFYNDKGFILLSLFMIPSKTARLVEIGIEALPSTLSTLQLIGIMTKIRDEPSGMIYGKEILKSVKEKDWIKLREGISISKEILIQAGVKSKSIIISKPQGAHPGGTAAVGKVVDGNLQTKIDNLFVCDASVFPTSPGMPPILTIVALAKYLAKNLT